MTIINTTIADHDMRQPGGGAVAQTGGSVVLINTILAGNSLEDSDRPQNCAGVITSQGHNLIGDPAGCTMTLLASDRTGDPGLGDFVDPGPPGQGHFPVRPGSPVIDTGDAAACSPTDQLGTPRRGPCDIGAIEFYPVVNDLVALETVTTAFDASPVPDGPAGTFRVTAAFTNTSPQPIEHLFAVVVELTGGNLLLNANGGPGGVGARLTPPGSASTPFGPGTMETLEFVIGLQSAAPFTFMIDLLGDPQLDELARR
jgi:hypothetical protein